MAKEEVLKLEGKVVDILPGGMFRVKIDQIPAPVIGVVSGKMRQHKIRILLGDSVEVEFSPYDLARGRIVRRK